MSGLIRVHVWVHLETRTVMRQESQVWAQLSLCGLESAEMLPRLCTGMPRLLHSLKCVSELVIRVPSGCWRISGGRGGGLDAESVLYKLQGSACLCTRRVMSPAYYG